MISQETNKYFGKIGAEEKVVSAVEFEDNMISLNIPMEGTTIKEWKLIPLMPPKVIIIFLASIHIIL